MIAALEAVLDENTRFYRDDFEKDVEKLIRAAGSTEQETTFYWMSRESGTWCEPERELFIRDSFAYKIWTFYADMPERIRAFRVDLRGMDEDGVRGIITPLDYSAHVRRVIRTAVPYWGMTLRYADGFTQSVEASDKHWHSETDVHGEIVEYAFAPKDERALQLAISAERAIQNQIRKAPQRAREPVR